MSKQKFSPEERWVIWDVYKRKCIYCSEPILDFSNLNIDHLLPESLHENQSKLQEILKKHSLPENYDINGYQNLIASCAMCNKRKNKEIILNPVLLHTANKNPEKIRKLVEIKKEKIMLGKDKQLTTLPFVYKFRGKKIRGPMSKSKLIDLRNEPLLDLDGFALEGFDGEDQKSPRIVNTVAEYEEAVAEGWYAATTFSIKMSNHFEIASSFLRAVEKAQSPKLAYFSDQKFTLGHCLDSLSAELANAMWVLEEDRYNPDPNLALSKLFEIEKTKVKIITRNEDFLHFEFDGSGFYYEELMRADFSDLGYEEILCKIYEYAVGGSFGYGSTILLQKTEPSGLAQIYR